MKSVYIYSYRPREQYMDAVETLEATGKVVHAPAEPNAMVPFTKDKWAVFEPANPTDLDFMMSFFLEDAYGRLGRITVISPVIPTSLVGVVEQVSNWNSFLSRYFFTGL